MNKRTPANARGGGDSQWHLDRRVPIALLLAIIAQSAGFGAWCATTNMRLNALEQKADVAAPQGERLTRVEVKVDNLIEGVAEIKSILRKEPGKSR